MRTYMEDLDITVVHLDDAMEWECWDNFDDDGKDVSSNASA